MRTVAVIGAGHGELAVAGHLAIRGHEVRICDRDAAVVEPVARAGIIEVTGKIEGKGKVALATTDLAAAVRGAEVIVIVVPGDAHGAVAEALVPHVTDGQMVVLKPGGTGGALEFDATFSRAGVRRRPLIAEIESFGFGSKTIAPATSRVATVKLKNRLAALPATDTARALTVLHDDFPQLVVASSVLETGFNHMNAMLHVATMVMNAGWVQTTKGEFEFYRDGVSPAVAQVIEAVDRERIAVSDAFGAGASPIREWIRQTYQVEAPTLWQTIQTVNANVYKTSKAPGTLASRYLSEDVPAGLVPIAALGAAAGVATPVMLSLIDLVSLVHGVEHRRAGRTLARMGLEGKTREQIRRFVETGAP